MRCTTLQLLASAAALGCVSSAPLPLKAALPVKTLADFVQRGSIHNPHFFEWSEQVRPTRPDPRGDPRAATARGVRPFTPSHTRDPTERTPTR